ncbi:hypothetical protein GCM10027614_27000 [Micromonospora vulcania]
MRPIHRRLAATAVGLVSLPVALVGCGIGGGGEKPAAKPRGYPPRRPAPGPASACRRTSTR